jgi:drug/metabolite transporter (DMT)-like permease
VSAALALLASVVWGGSDFYASLLSRRLTATIVVSLTQAIALALLLAGLPLAHVPTGWYLLDGAAAGVFGLIAIIAFYQAMAVGPMSLVAPVTAAGSVIPVLYGVAGGERLNAVEAAGIGLALVGVVLASGPQLRGETPGSRRVLMLAAVAAVGFGLVFPLLARGGHTSVYGTLAVQRLVSVAGLAAVLPRRAGRAPAAGGIRARTWLALVGLGVTDVGANFAYTVATRGGGLAVVTVLASLYPVVTAILARLILAERLRGVQAAGVATALVGIVLVNL